MGIFFFFYPLLYRTKEGWNSELSLVRFVMTTRTPPLPTAEAANEQTLPARPHVD